MSTRRGLRRRNHRPRKRGMKLHERISSLLRLLQSSDVDAIETGNLLTKIAVLYPKINPKKQKELFSEIIRNNTLEIAPEVNFIDDFITYKIVHSYSKESISIIIDDKCITDKLLVPRLDRNLLELEPSLISLL